MNSASLVSARNRMLFDYGLSLRPKNAQPARAAFHPGRLGAGLARVCLFEAKAGERLFCRLAGSDVVRGLGIEISGRDLLGYTPAYLRQHRLDCYRYILAGAVMLNTRSCRTSLGRTVRWQEVILPFADRTAEGCQQVLLAGDFGPLAFGEQASSPQAALGEPDSAAFVWL